MARSRQLKLVQELLQIDEWETFEVKRAACNPRKLLEPLCALANNNGGTLVIGVEDPAKALSEERLIGMSENPDNISEFLKLVRTEFDPPLQQLINYREENIINTSNEEDRICIVRVQKSDDIHSLKNGDTFIRRGNQNVKVGAQEILRLRYERGSIKYENEIVPKIGIDALDKELLDQYQVDTQSTGTDIWQFLRDNGLATTKNELTNASVLLFAKNPAVTLGSKCSIKISHYYGTKQTFSGEPNLVRRPFTIEGSLLSQIKNAVNYFQEAVKESPPKMHGGVFRPGLLIPEWVFQEAIANAVIHRNYTIQDDIQVRIFDDRIEVESPGSYPAHITSLNLRSERFARNPTIQRVLNRFRDAPNLDIGEGVDRMFEIMHSHNLYDPVYAPSKQRPNSVRVTLINLQRINYWDTISNYIDKNGRITNREAREITGIQDTLQVSRLLSDWVAGGLLEKQGGKTRGAYYIKTGQDIFALFFKGYEK